MLVISAYSATTLAVELTAEIIPGYDDNPYRLADNLNPDSSLFLDTKIKLEHKVDKIRLRAKVTNRVHDGVDDADSLTTKLDARYKTKYELAGKDAVSQVNIEYKYKDKTYVARSTGLVGTDSGLDISDRYDYDSWKIGAKAMVSLNKALKVGLELDYIIKDYEDYNIAGLTDLDYDQIGLTNDWQYKIDKQSQFGLALNVSRRDFDNKREKDLLGNKISGTDLEYDYWSITTKYDRDITKKLESKLLYSYEQRRGSGDGYYDTDYSRVSGKLSYKADDTLKITGGITYQDREYLNTSNFDENDDASPSTEGYTVNLGLEKDVMQAKDFPTSIVAGIRYDDYDSNNSSYEYDRSQVYAGVKIGFGQ